MGTLLDLFGILDNWDRDTFPERFEVNPDPAIDSARKALMGQGDLKAALELINQQLNRVRPILRALRFDVIEEVRSEKGWSPGKLLRLGSELHQLAALINMRLGQWYDARDHLIRAIACEPENPNPRFYFVDFYMEMAAYTDAFDLLDKTSESGDSVIRFIQLYRLTLDVQLRGAEMAARACYERLCAMENARLFGELARLRIEQLNCHNYESPSLERMDMMFRGAGERLNSGELEMALSEFLQVLSWHPDHANTWYLVGHIFLMMALDASDTIAAGQPVDKRLSPTSINDVQYRQLQNAVQAYCAASRFQHIFPQAHLELANCNLLLGLPGAALEAATTALEQAPEDAAAFATFAQASLLNADFAGAELAAQTAIRIDPQEPTALHTLSLLRRARKDQNYGE